MFRHEMLKLLLVLLAISLLMALTGIGKRQMVVLALLDRSSKDTEDDLDCFVEIEAEVKGSSRVQLYENALRALRDNKIPENADLDTAFCRDFKINYITRDVNTAIVDFSSKNLHGSPSQERLLIGQIVRTLTQSFDEVESVTFTVDGESAETLMGHVDISQVFTSANIHMI